MRNTDQFIRMCRPGRTVMVKDFSIGDSELRIVKRREGNRIVFVVALDDQRNPREVWLDLNCEALKSCSFFYPDVVRADLRDRKGKVCIRYEFC